MRPLFQTSLHPNEDMDDGEEMEETAGQTEWVDENPSKAPKLREQRAKPVSEVQQQKIKFMDQLKEVWGGHWHRRLGGICPKQPEWAFLDQLSKFAKEEADIDKVIPLLKRVVEERVEMNSYVEWLNYPHLITKDISQARRLYSEQVAMEKSQQEKSQKTVQKNSRLATREKSQKATHEKSQKATHEKSQQAEKSRRLEEIFQKMDAYHQQLKEAAGALQGAANLFGGAVNHWESMKDLFKNMLQEREKDKPVAEAATDIDNGDSVHADDGQVMELDDGHVVEVNEHESERERSTIMYRGGSRGRPSKRGRGEGWGRGRGRGRGIARNRSGAAVHSRLRSSLSSERVNISKSQSTVGAETSCRNARPALQTNGYHDNSRTDNQYQEVEEGLELQPIASQTILRRSIISEALVSKAPPVSKEVSIKSRSVPTIQTSDTPNPTPLPSSRGDYYGPFLMSTPPPKDQSLTRPGQSRVGWGSESLSTSQRGGLNTEISHNIYSINHDKDHKNPGPQPELPLSELPPLLPSIPRRSPVSTSAPNTYPAYPATQYAPGHRPLTGRGRGDVPAEITGHLTAKEALSLLPPQSPHIEYPDLANQEGFSRVTISNILGGGVQATFPILSQKKRHKYSVPGYICAGRSLNPNLPDKPCQNAVMEVTYADKKHLGKELPLFIRHQANEWFYYGNYIPVKYHYLSHEGWISEFTENDKETWAKNLTEHQRGRDILRRAGLNEFQQSDPSKAMILLEREDHVHPQIRLVLLVLRAVRWDGVMYNMLMEQKTKGIMRDRRVERRIYAESDEDEEDVDLSVGRKKKYGILRDRIVKRRIYVDESDEDDEDEEDVDLVVGQKKKDGILRDRIVKKRRIFADESDEDEEVGYDDRKSDDRTPTIRVTTDDDSSKGVGMKKEDMVSSDLLPVRAGLGKRKRMFIDDEWHP